MGTRGLYTFKDENGAYNVYKHYDNYPSGAVQAIKASFENAWELPRFEADEFAAAFIAANKEKSGGVRLVKSGKPDKVAPRDIEYRYEITYRKPKGKEDDVFETGVLEIACFETNYAWQEGSKDHINLLFRGTFENFETFLGMNKETIA